MSKEAFDTFKQLSQKYLLVSGCCKLIRSGEEGYVFQNHNDDTIWAASGLYDEDLMADAFKNTVFLNEDVPSGGGQYVFDALLSYIPEQRGNYPPPNIEAPAYYYVEHIEFEPEDTGLLNPEKQEQ